MAKFNDRRIVIQLINIENKIQVDDNMDDIAHNIHRHAVMADMMLPGWYDGWEAIYDAVAVQFAGINDNRHVMKEIYVATDGDMAFILMHIHLEQFYDGAPRIFAFRQFDTFQKIGERWLCRQAHCFVPIEPDTGNRARGALPVREEWKWPTDTLPSAAVSEERAKREIRAWFDARIASDSVDAVMRRIGPREDVIVYAPYLPGEYRGQQECRDYYASVFDSVASIEAEVTDYHVATNGLMGAIMSRQNLAIHMRDSTTRRISVRQSHGLRRVGDAWQSMIEMTSFPVDLKTGEPVTWIGQGAECEIEPDHDTSLSVPAP